MANVSDDGYLTATFQMPDYDPASVKIYIDGFETGAGLGILYDQDSHPETCPRCGSDPSMWTGWAEQAPTWDEHGEPASPAVAGRGCCCGLAWRIEFPLDAVLIG